MDDETDVVGRELREVCDRASQLARTLTNAEQSGLVLRHEGDWQWVTHGGSDPLILSSVDELLDEDEPRIESDVNGSESFPPLEGPVRSYVGVPVLADTDERLGILCVASSVPDAFDESTVESLADLAGLVARALRHADAVASDTRHDDFLENIPVGVYRSTPDGRILYANSRLADLFGVDSVEALCDVDLNDEGVAQDDRAAFKEKVERQGQIAQNETVWTRADGTQVDVLETARVVRDTDGNVRYYEGIVEDITDRKRAERELRAARDFNEAALNSLPGTFYLIDDELRFRRWNDELERVTGLSRDQVAESHPLRLIAEEDRENVARRIEEVFGAGHDVTVEARILTADGREVPYFLTGARVQIDGERFLVGMGIDISERVQAEEAMKNAKQEAEEMDRLKSVFLANMSHEIRTPLTSILGFADILSDEIDGEATRLVELIRQSGTRLQETLTSVLELARLERESSKVDTERCNLVERVEETLDLMEPQVESNDLELRRQLPSEPVHVQADPRILHRVLTNLVSNAVKFTEEGEIAVSVGLQGQDVVLAIRDTGVGIRDDFLDHIFDEFRQESEGLRRAHEGSGLGLTITRRLVERMGGRIEVESTKGEGSTFTVRLPQAPPEDRPSTSESSATA